MEYICTMRIYNMPFELFLQLSKDEFFSAKGHALEFKYCTLVMATGLSRPGKSWEGPGTGWDRTGPRDLEGPVVLWSRD